MKTIIAEKPSVAREIARVVKATRREAGYLTGNGYNVTWAFGHLVQPALPDGYGIKGFHPACSARASISSWRRMRGARAS